MPEEKKNLIPFSNSIDKERKTPLSLLSFNINTHKKTDPMDKAMYVLKMDEIGIDRDSRREKILNFFPDNSPQGAKTVETIINKTTGFDNRQLNSLLNYVRLKDFRNNEKFIQILDQNIEKTWLEEL